MCSGCNEARRPQQKTSELPALRERERVVPGLWCSMDELTLGNIYWRHDKWVHSLKKRTLSNLETTRRCGLHLPPWTERTNIITAFLLTGLPPLHSSLLPLPPSPVSYFSSCSCFSSSFLSSLLPVLFLLPPLPPPFSSLTPAAYLKTADSPTHYNTATAGPKGYLVT